MKKIILILLLLLITASCNKFIVRNVYERSYPTEKLAINDLYHQTYSYGLDSIPLDQWILLDITTDSSQILEKIAIKYLNEESFYQFIYRDMCSIKEHKYNLLIRYAGKKKDLK